MTRLGQYATTSLDTTTQHPTTQHTTTQHPTTQHPTTQHTTTQHPTTQHPTTQHPTTQHPTTQHPTTQHTTTQHTAGLVRLEQVLRQIGDVVVAFSGGADSAFLAAVALRTLGGPRVLCATAVSPSLGEEDEAHCRALAKEWGMRWTAVATSEMEDAGYVANGADRCARCKDALMAVLGPLAASSGATVVLGVNLDDLGDHRPGQLVAAAAGARFPLVEAGLTKADVRAWSRELGLRTWDRPAGACLASRVPYGTPVTVPTLRAIAAAEAGVRALGFHQFRVRHHGKVARLEVAEGELGEALQRRDELVVAVKGAGYTFVALDLEGFHSGSMNRLLARDGTP